MSQEAPHVASSSTFVIPEHVADAWRRLAQGAGASPDLQAVLQLLGREWSAGTSPSDPRAFDTFLFSQGLDRKWKHLPKDIEAQYKSKFFDLHATKRDETAKLVEGISRGPNCAAFFRALGTLSSDLKELAYEVGLHSACDKNRISILSFLSLERPDFVRRCLDSVDSHSAIFKYFVSFLETPAAKVLITDHELTDQEMRAPGDAARLVAIAAASPHRQRELLAQRDRQGLLLHLAAGMLAELPDAGFGKYLRFRFAILICSADPRGPHSGAAIAELIDSKQANVGSILAGIGREPLTKALSQVEGVVSAEHEPYVAGLIDALAEHFVEELRSRQEQLVALSNAKGATLSLSAESALLTSGASSEADFEAFALRKLRTDKTGRAIQWLIEHPHRLSLIRPSKIPFSTWRGVLRTFIAVRPADALGFVTKTLSAVPEPKRDRYWQDALSALATGTSTDESALAAFVIDEISRSHEKHLFVAAEPILTIVRRRFWDVAAQTGTNTNRIRLFDSVIRNVSETELLRLLESGARIKAFADLVAAELFPKAIEDERLSPEALKAITNAELLVRLANVLSASTLAHYDFLRNLPDEWSIQRSKIKQTIAAEAKRGVDIALRHSSLYPGLKQGLDKCAAAISIWEDADVPRLDPAVTALSRLARPERHKADKGILETLFRRSNPSQHDFALFAGVNPWTIDVSFGESGKWPKKELLIVHIARSFAYFANLRKRAEVFMAGLEEASRVELAISLRDPLADIESELAGYFAFRDVLQSSGLEPVESFLGRAVRETEFSSERHKIIRDPTASGAFRTASLGIRVGDKVIGASILERLGNDENDRD